MLVIFGRRDEATTFGQLEIPCSRCGQATPHSQQIVKLRFTLFFVPLIGLGELYQVVCNVCALTTVAFGALHAQLEDKYRALQVPARPTLNARGDPTCPRVHARWTSAH